MWILDKAFETLSPDDSWSKDKRDKRLFWKVRFIIAFHIFLINLVIFNELHDYNLDSSNWSTVLINRFLFDYQFLAVIAYSYLVIHGITFLWTIIDHWLHKFSYRGFKKLSSWIPKLYSDKDRTFTGSKSVLNSELLKGQFVTKRNNHVAANRETKELLKMLNRIQCRFDSDEIYFKFLVWLASFEIIVFVVASPELFHWSIKLILILFFVLKTISLPIENLIGYAMERVIRYIQTIPRESEVS